MRGIGIDFSGFTKQTETLLCGIGGNDLIDEFRRRNISTDALRKLTKGDFILLGASEDHAARMVDTLSISKKKGLNTEPKCYEKISDYIEILKLGEKQLAIAQAFMTYCRFRLQNERINCFIEPDRALSASQTLCIATDVTLKEINEAELKLRQLEAAMITPKHKSTRSYVLYCTPVGIICIAMCRLLMNRFWK